MPVIDLTTTIHAPLERCFDLARSIDLHKLSTKGTDEQAVAGVTSGLIGKGQQVTWRAKHFYITQRLTSQITEYTYPYHFRDEMLKGVFTMIRHDHWFEMVGGHTIMKDRFEFASPVGILGVIFNRLILIKYLRRFLVERNGMIKKVAEGDQWKQLLNR